MDYVSEEDKGFWYTLDRHLPEQEFINKVQEKRGYVIYDDNKPVGILRYNLFWDNLPFLCLIYLQEDYRRNGFGSQAMKQWEAEMIMLGFKAVMVSTQVDEDAQHFYRKIGYKDCGCLVLDLPTLRQPLEMFLIKDLQ